MPYVETSGARIFYQITGQGTPIVFVHEFGGDHRSWDDQVRHLARGHQCVVIAQRGYPPSDCPVAESQYGQAQLTSDVIAVMDAAQIDRAHIVGLSMGGYTTLMLGLQDPSRARSLISAGAGSGSPKASHAAFAAECHTTAAVYERLQRIDADAMGHGGTRIQLKHKDPLGWQRFIEHLSDHPAHAAAKTLRQVQARRPSLYDFEAGLKALAVPTLLIVGDEDEPCLDVNLWIKRIAPAAQLAMFPGSGHAVNLEEPAAFNALIERFITQVERGQWRPRDARSAPGSLTSLSVGTLAQAHDQV
jgi:pimeloyl-ACP methyl ester carboxylesterase